MSEKQMHPKLERILQRLSAIHEQVQRIAEEEARAVKVGGAAAQGVLDPQRERLLNESEELLDKAEEILRGDSRSPQ